LHLTEQQLSEVEAVGLRAPEPEVDERQVRAVRGDEQVAVQASPCAVPYRAGTTCAATRPSA
jgi:hypothetical protein